MGRRKIVDETEVIRWFEEGRTYAWMSTEYRRKYGVETGASMWSNFAYRRGIERRIQRDDDLVPWAVDKQHRWAYPLQMLRAEGRRRYGLPSSEAMLDRLDRWLDKMKGDDTVVHYDVATGFGYVKRRPNIDTDLIRVPDHKTTTRKNSGR